MELSIIIPTYDEARKIGRDIKAASAFLVARMGGGEIIVADDGSRDNTPGHCLGNPDSRGVTLHILRSAEHKGKGFALRSGIAASHGRYVMFADSGLTTPYENALRGIELIRSGQCELAHGSRKLPESIVHRPQQRDRKISSALLPDHDAIPVPCPGRTYRHAMRIQGLSRRCRTHAFPGMCCRWFPLRCRDAVARRATWIHRPRVSHRVEL